MSLSKQFDKQKQFSFIVLTLAAMIIFAASAFAQEAPKYEIGGHFSLIRLRDLDTTDAGVGGRFGVNVTQWLGLEAEFTSFPQLEGRQLQGGRKVQGLFGVKTGVRSEKFGVFAKVRPGFMRFGRNEIANPCPPDTVCTAAIILKEQTNFALDVGGVLEYYPSRRFVTRFDLGDTIVRFGTGSLPAGRAYTGHNLQFNVGFGVRF